MVSKSSGSSMHFTMNDDSDDPDWEEDADIIKEEDADLIDEEADLANDDPVPGHHSYDSVPERSPSYPRRGTIGKGRGRGANRFAKHEPVPGHVQRAGKRKIRPMKRSVLRGPTQWHLGKAGRRKKRSPRTR